MALWFDVLTQVALLHQLKPFDFNPRKRILEGVLDFECLRDWKSIASEDHYTAPGVSDHPYYWMELSLLQG